MTINFQCPISIHDLVVHQDLGRLPGVTMLNSPNHGVLGSRNLESTCALLARFGFDRREDRYLPPRAADALYGLKGATKEAFLRVRGSDAGGLRVVETSHAPAQAGPYDPRPVAIDLYTREIDRSLAIARDAGLSCGELVEYSLGPLQLKEVEVEDEDGLRLVFIEIETRRPSVLDHLAERLHSEVHSIVFSVPSAEDALALWRDAGGLHVLVDAPIQGPIISQLMGLPRPNVPVRFVLLCDEQASPARFEFIEFTEDRGTPLPGGPLRAGLHAAAFHVADLNNVCQRLADCSFREPVEVDGVPAVAGEAPGGLCFELWQNS